jgi:hypothetical protein
MKKILVMLALLVSVNSFAHHLDAKGWCSVSGGRAFFTTVQFANNLNVQVQYKPYNASDNSDPWLTGYNFNTPAFGSTVTIFSLPQPVQSQRIKVRFRYKSTSSSNWSSWSSSQNSSTSLYVGCSALPVKFVSFSAEAITNTYFKITFEVGEAQDVQMFTVMVSEDGVNYKSAVVVVPDALQPNKKYTTYITIK